MKIEGIDFKATDIQFINDNICSINAKITDFKATSPDASAIKIYLKDKFNRTSKTILDEIIAKTHDKDFKIGDIENIANEYILYKTDVDHYIRNKFKQEYIALDIKKELTKNILNTYKENMESGMYRILKSDIQNLSLKLAEILRMDGFYKNLLNLNPGVYAANAGDSAQFMFLSRAILAGYNCSNVDVRSSRYDAVIDYEGVLLKVQVKGVSGTSISFKDRDRGGQGIDQTHASNIGKVITGEDCDIYVAVDKSCGLCYIIPVKEYIDKLSDEEKKKSISLSKVSNYLENWKIINVTASEKKN